MKSRYFPDDENWTVETGSALDNEYLQSLGTFDIVYSWGVLHHTGDMWSALENVAKNVGLGGMLFIALYNDQGRASSIWWQLKKAYVRLPGILKWIVLLPCYIRLWGPAMIRDMIRLKPFKTWIDYSQNRGMSPHRDVIDWVGGFPFEVAKPDDIFRFYYKRDYVLTTLRTCGGGLGCNEYVFRKKEHMLHPSTPRLAQ